MYIDFSSFFDQSLRETAGFYPAKSHEKAFLRISDGLAHHHSVFFLRGKAGVGKTHILKRLYRKPEPLLRKGWLSAHSPSVSMIMQSIADLHGIRWDPSNPNKLRQRLVEDLKNNKIAVIFIDNVTNLDVETVIKLSSILRWRKQSLAKVVFAGGYKLSSALTMFVKKNDVKAIQCKLSALDEAEVHAYLVQLSRVSGYAGKSPFDKGAVHALIKHSHGIPSKINRLCDFCLFVARTHNHFVLDAGLINKAAVDLKKLNLWVKEEQNFRKKSKNSDSKDDSSRNQSKPETGFNQETSFKPKKTISVCVAGSKDQPVKNLRSHQDNNDITDEWNKAVNSYLSKHPDDSDRINNETTRETSVRPVFVICLLLSLLFGMLYYLSDAGKSFGLRLPEVFSSNLVDSRTIDNDAKKGDAAPTQLEMIDTGISNSKESVESALILSVWNNKSIEIKELLKLGVDVNTRNHFGQTPLMIAAMLGNEDLVSLMLDNAAAINLIDNKGLTAIMLAARNGQVNVIEYLIAQGADINIQDKKGMTAIMHGASFGHKETVELILKHKPKLELKNNNGQSADVIARALGYESIATIITTAQ